MTQPHGDPLERLNRLWSQLMLALSRSGRRAEALATYREVRVILGAELGIDPETALPLIATSTAELRAATQAEFIELLRTIHVRSGLSLPEISRRAGRVLPRSQVYSLFKRGKLPTKPEQVRAFVTICGLSEPQVARVLELWATLREQTEPPLDRAGAFHTIRRRSSRGPVPEPREAPASAGAS